MAFAYVMNGPGVDQLERIECAPRKPAAGEVQIQIKASSLNFHDYVTLLGFIPDIDYPRVPLSDGCGVVSAIGEGVTNFKEGDTVITLFYPDWQNGNPSSKRKKKILGESSDGCLQEFLNLNAAAVAHAPSTLSAEQAATLVCAGHTAWYALMEEHALQAKDTLLIQGSGGVSVFALQFAKALGATVIATSSSDEKLQKLKALGADHLVNYTTHPDWEERVLELTGGVDAVLDVGGEATLGKSVRCTNIDGFIAVIGVLSGFGDASVPIIDVMQKNLTIKGITVGCAESLQRMCHFVEQHNLQPVISHTLAASELAQALELMQNGEHFGKIAIQVK